MTRASVSMLALALLAACGGGGGGAPATVAPAPDPVTACNAGVAATPQALSAADVQRVLGQGAEAAAALGAKATIAVSDRAGNVLAVYRMTGARTTLDIRSGNPNNTAASPQGLDGLANFIPSELGAIAKAVTGAYLSSSGNAFSTRTASFIVQEHFAPTIARSAAGPLFGVQFSQLPCGDLVTRGTGVGVGPKRSPLGLSADPGGFPLYKNGRVVGGVGVLADGVYGLDAAPLTSGADLDERIAQSALKGFEAPACIRGDRITAGGVNLPYSNSDAATVTVSAAAPSAGALLPVAGYFGGAVLAGSAFGEAASGFAADAVNFQAQQGQVLLAPDGSGRYAPRASLAPLPAGEGLSAGEVKEMLAQALAVANRARAQIRNPAGSMAQVTVSVVDTGGNVLGLVRSADAPVFGVDVSLQKARTAAFFSSAQAGAQLSAVGPIAYSNGTSSGTPFLLAAYVSATRAFFANSALFGDGLAFSDRSVGNIARPYFPDGIDGSPAGPLSKALPSWSPFNVGLQLDLVYGQLVGAILDPASSASSCTAPQVTGLDNGMQTFPGGFPVYRGARLIGGIGVSGDGVDQDDMIGMLGLARAATALGTGIGHAPPARRADTLGRSGLNLRYVQCPQAPFNNSTEQDVCNGL